MTEAQAGIFNLTSPVVMTFPNLFAPKAFKGKTGKDLGEPKYSANLVFDPASQDFLDIKALVAKLARAKWPGVDFKTLVLPFINGTKSADDRKAKGKDDNEWMRGKVAIPARSKFQPRLSGVENGRIVDYEDEAVQAAKKAKFFFGAEVLAQLNLVAYDPVGSNGRAGVTAYLNMVMVTGKGTKLSGGATAAETFKGYAGAASMEDPTGGAGLDDQIPF